jgi:hypothetical protein
MRPLTSFGLANAALESVYEEENFQRPSASPGLEVHPIKSNSLNSTQENSQEFQKETCDKNLERFIFNLGITQRYVKLFAISLRFHF